MIDLYNNLSEDDFLITLENCLSLKDKRNFKHKYVNHITEKAKFIFKEHSEWCINNGILITPFVIYNDKELSSNYSIDDLIYFR